ncbi:2-oxoacid:acceptor oxidoreductase family protein [Natranaerobius thermophilus]|uniref:2-oxoglutarate ferredoxin oxidoreductase, gamma subunit n=1 Tax=Natranaerobius thermophilus (strain ATCC BAA-1301 / DSM 18059 / JW/NM-WN-LF) TaxID=457570 RepID=B2A507_NATTJ|nr:2-oxoacid:acceptor oxidoreductase family protein [Natranaerobius thermophilus]ACB85249.1 2-oxoglutarate ferredoxin oxidoreductase, gamma subunit [Natranaerobius thermophilus JW/NM-WN-LF]
MQEVIMAGFGGQGVMSMGQLLTYAGMLESKGVAWMPSYGPEMRGGTANCTVVITDEEQVGSPIVSNPDTLIAMNYPSLVKFKDSIKAGGVLLYNSSLIEEEVESIDDVDIYPIPANEIANELGESRIANMVMLGAFIEKTHAVSIDSVLESLKKVLPEKRHNLIPVNEKALRKGAEMVK